MKQVMVLIQSLWCLFFFSHCLQEILWLSFFSIFNGLKHNFKTEIFLLVYLVFFVCTFGSNEAPAICSCPFNLLLKKYFQEDKKFQELLLQYAILEAKKRVERNMSGPWKGKWKTHWKKITSSDLNSEFCCQ